MEAFSQTLWNPLGLLGINLDILKINKTTVLNTWFVLLLFIITFLLLRRYLNKPQSIVYYLSTQAVASFMDLVSQTIGMFVYQHFAFIFSLFTFILVCNCIPIIPWTTEPTQDLNTTLALGAISFFYKDFYAIITNGFSGYIHEFLQPFFLMFPINVIGHFSKIISLSFRLFGNIFGGSLIMELYHALIAKHIILEIIGLISGLNLLILLFFGVFEGVIQAFVFSMLSLAYLSLSLQKEPAGET